MNRRILYFATALLFSGFLAAAQTAPKATVEGIVTRANSGQPLKGATVTLLRANTAGNAELQNRLGTLISNLGGGAVAVNTDANGRFVITGVEPGDYRISAQREGFIRSEFGQRTPTGTGVTVKLAANQRFTANLPMTQGSVISGRVITPDGDPALDAPVQAYTYQYANGERTLAQVANAQTNDLGEYRLFGLEPGEYFVSVTSRELADQTPVGSVDVAARQAAARGGRGGGRGEAQGIQALAALAEGIGPLLQGVAGNTGNPPVYYPGTLDPDGATPITVAAATEVRSVDFNLRPSRTATVSGRVSASFPLNAPAANAGPRGGRGGGDNLIQNLAQQFLLGPTSVQVNLTREGTARSRRNGLLGLRLGSTPVNTDGTFEIKGVAPGQYNLTATARDPNGQEHSARTRVDVASADVGNVVVALRAGVEVRGRVVVDAPTQQFKMTNVRVSLVADDGAAGGARGLAAAVAGAAGAAGGGGGRGGLLAQVMGAGGQLATEAVAEDGTFTLKNVGALEYRVRVTGLPQGAYLVSGRLGSKDALSGPFTVDDSSAVLQLQLGFTPGRVSGVVSDARGNATPGVQVVLVPDEARRGRTDAYFTTNSDQNGQFTLNNVPPGSYKLFAWEDIPAGAYQYPDFIRNYEDRGQAITVTPNGMISANARLIPAS